MMNNERYQRQVALLLQVLPLFDRLGTAMLNGKDFPYFALKGGTAINLFVHDMPRLSVDIDLAYLPIESRDKTLETIGSLLEEFSSLVERFIPNVTVLKKMTNGRKRVSKLVVQKDGVQVKIEPNEILRGAVYEPVRMDLSSRISEEFELELSTTVLSFADLYGGKICAALDRQHPRDLFDVKLLLEHDGFSEEVRKAFVIYLISHNRPMDELLNPNFKDFKDAFENQFKGMTESPVSYQELGDARIELLQTIREQLSDDDRSLILSIAEGEPDWSLTEFAHVKDLPAIQWKLKNVAQMESGKREEAARKLRSLFEE